jgi:hypothetical protein
MKSKPQSLLTSAMIRKRIKSRGFTEAASRNLQVTASLSIGCLGFSRMIARLFRTLFASSFLLLANGIRNLMADHQKLLESQMSVRTKHLEG